MENKKTEIKVGLTVLVGLITFLWILGWTKNLSLFNDKKILKVKFGRVAGLETGDPVMINGVKKGFIKDVSLSGDSVLTVITLDKDAKLFSDATFSIMMLDLMGGKKVEIYSGRSNIPLDLSKTYNGKFLGDISTAVAALSSLQSDITTIVKQLRVALNSLNGLMRGDSIKTKLMDALSNVNATAKSANEFIASNKNLLSNLIVNSNSLVLAIDSLLKQNGKGINSLVNNGNKFVLSSKKLVDSLNSFTSEIKNKKNNLGKIIYDKKYLTQLRETIKKLNKLTEILIKQLNNGGLNVDIF